MDRPICGYTQVVIRENSGAVTPMTATVIKKWHLLNVPLAVGHHYNQVPLYSYYK